MKTIRKTTRFLRSHQTRSAASARLSRLATAATLVLLALAALPLGLPAQNKLVNTSGTVFDSGNTYTSVPGLAALEVSSNGLASPAVYSGTAITLSTVAGITGATAVRAADGGVACLFSSTLLVPDVTAGRLGGVGSSGTLHVYDSIGQSNSGGVDVVGVGSKLIADNFDITITTAQALAINIYTNGAAEVYNSRLITTADGGVVLGTASGGTLVAGNLQLIATGAGDTVGFRGSGASLTLTNSEITARTGITVRDFTDGVRLENTIINATDTGLNLLGNAPFTISGGAINTIGGNALITSSTVRQDIHISDHATIQGGITNTASGTLNVTLDASTLRGDIANTGGGATALTLANAATGAGGFTGGALNIRDPASHWTFTKNSTPDRIENHGVIRVGEHGNYIAVHSDSISGDGAWYFPVNSDTGSKSTVTGSTAATSHPHGKIDATGDGRLDLKAVAATLVTGENKGNWIWDDFDWGLEKYTQDDHDPDGNPRFIQNGTSPAGAVLNSAVVLQQAMWFAQNDSLAKRLGDLRLSDQPDQPAQTDRPDRPYPSAQPDQPDRSAQPARPARPRNTAALWTRAYAQRLNLDAEVAGRSFTQQLYGIDLGADRAWPLAAGSATLHTGLYLGYARADADYNAPRADAELTSTHGGLYATYRRKSGLYIDAILKIADIKNTLRAPAAAATTLEAAYDNLNLGLTLELGQRFTLRNDWFMEPQLQLAALRIRAKDYTAATPDAATTLRIAATDMDALQARLAYTVGKRVRLTNGGVMQPYARVGGAALTSSGGEIRNAYQRLRPNIDGLRAEFGAGVAWQLSASHQLYFDYEASYAEDYSKPWGLTAGYRWQF